MKAKHTPTPTELLEALKAAYKLINEGIAFNIEEKYKTIKLLGDIIGNTQEEIHANARLIAAAPELLTKLKVVKSLLEKLAIQTEEQLEELDSFPELKKEVPPWFLGYYINLKNSRLKDYQAIVKDISPIIEKAESK